MATQRICSIPGCGKPRRDRLLCPMHSWRLRTHGTTDDRPRQTSCSVSGCLRPLRAGGWCELHYRRMKRHGQLDVPEKVSRRATCSVEGCDATAHARGLCRPHYGRQRQLEKPISCMRHGEGLRFLEAAVASNVDDCIIWPAVNRGYGVILVSGRSIGVHRYVCERTHGPPPFSDAQAAHNCGQGRQGCVNPRHIRWATAQENSADKERHGTTARGERVAAAKLSASIVREIRTSTEGSTIIGRRYGVAATTIRNIRKGKTWKHLL